MCLIDLEKAFDRVLRRVLDWAMRKRGIPEAMVKAVMSLYEGAKTRLRVGLQLSEEFKVKVGVHQGSALSEGRHWAEDEVTVSKIDPCVICGKRVRANSVLCVKCRKWIHERCAKVKRVTLRLGRNFVCGRCMKEADEFMDSVEKLCEEVETVRGFCYLGECRRWL